MSCLVLVQTSDVRSQGTDIPHWLNSVPHSREQRQLYALQCHTAADMLSLWPLLHAVLP